MAHRNLVINSRHKQGSLKKVDTAKLNRQEITPEAKVLPSKGAFNDSQQADEIGDNLIFSRIFF